MPYSQPPGPPGPPRQAHPGGPPPPPNQGYPPPGPPHGGQLQYQPYPPHGYPQGLPLPPGNLPPPPHDEAQHHAYIQQQMQMGGHPPPHPPPPQSSGPPPGYGNDGRAGGPTYGHFPPPQPAGGHPQQQQPPNERVKVIRGSAGGGPHRRDSTDSDGGGGHANGVHRKEKRRRIVVGGRDPSKERFHKFFMETRERLTVTNRILLANPSDSGEYALRLYPYSLERSALLSQIGHDEDNGLESAQTTYDEEKTKIEDEWKKGKERIRERLLESLEERRKKAREEMASDGALADVPTFDPPAPPRSSTRDRKPPPFVLAAPHPFGAAGEDMVSPFPLPLTSYAGGTGAWSAKGKRQKGVGAGGLTLGKAISALQGLKESEIEADLGEVKKAVKRKRGTRQSASTTSSPPSPTTLALAALNMTRDDLARHTDQMRCFLSAAAPPIHTLPQNQVIHPYSNHPSSSTTTSASAVKSETTDPLPILPTRPSMDAVLERGERRKKDLKRQYSNSIGSSTSTGLDDHHQSGNNNTTAVEDFPPPPSSGNNTTDPTATAASNANALPTPGLLYPAAPTSSDSRTVAKGASRSSSVCSSLAYQQDVFYTSRPPSVAPTMSLTHPSLRRSQSISSQASGHQSVAGDDVGDPDTNSTVDETHAESVDEILGLAPAPSRQQHISDSADAASSGHQTSGVTLQTPVKAPYNPVASGSTPYQPVPLPSSSSATRVGGGAYPSSSPVYKYQPATSPAGPRTPYRPPIHLKHPLTANVPGRPRSALHSSSPMPMPATSSPAHDSSPVNLAALPFRLPPGPRLTSKPHYSYAALIGQALMSSPTQRLSLNQIYTWISMAYPYFKRGEAGWQNSIRHNLSLNGCFVKIKRDDGEKGKGSWWSIREGDEACFAGGGFQRQGRANGRKRKGKADKDQDANAEAAEATEQDDEGASPKKKKKTTSTSSGYRPATGSDPNSMIPRGGYSRSASTSTTATSVHTMASSASYDSVASYATGGYGVPIYYGTTPYGAGYVQYATSHPSGVPPSFPSAMSAEPHPAFAGTSTERRGGSTHVRTPASNGYALRPAASHPSSSPLASRSTRSIEMSSEDEEEEEPESEDDQPENASNRAMTEMRMPPHRSPVHTLSSQQSPTRSLRSPTAYMEPGRVQDVREMYEGVSHERHVDSLTMEEEQAEAEREQSPTAHDAVMLPPASQDTAPLPLGQPFALSDSAATAVEDNEEGAEDAPGIEKSTLQPGFHFVPPLPKTSTDTAEDTVTVKQEPDGGATRGLDDEGFSNFFSSSPVHQRSRQNARFPTSRANGSSDLLSRVIESKTAKRGSTHVRQQSTSGASPTKPIFPAVPTTPRRDARPRTPPPPSERAPKEPAQENEDDRLLKDMDPTVAAAVTALTSLSPMRTPVSHAALHMSPAPPRSSDLAQYKHSLGPHSPFRTPGRTPSTAGRPFDYYDYLGDGVGGSGDDSATKSMLGSGLVPRTPATPMTGGIFGSHNLYQSPSLPSPGWRRY
ncbi:hypothetical protein FRC05_000521 [Tulasnella sp. 425]|nr:hypothetical protein FRC05_000521 [Tulasnella sp. 425]